MSKKILIADDHYVVKIALAIILKKLNISIIIDHVKTQNHIIQKLTNTKYDLLILDIRINSKASIIKKLKQMNPTLKILIFTDSINEKISLQYLFEGADAFLAKDSDEIKITNTLNSILTKEFYYSQEFIFNTIKEDSTLCQ
ncbi:response regulator [Chryseobacterium fistulae]|uniref:Virulence factors putative positive transcription regulator BvgA n=1 Tax=Chryseobacterium fistulae TaxID=2675058 RepID=A0A6N4XWC7_9FLAO|nr:response regulator [Chryseobacterium fistulae]CAA7392542.1 Virulence factors putative positive transcription regulator BvgA [Chryseobacterium fistulae]